MLGKCEKLRFLYTLPYSALTARADALHCDVGSSECMGTIRERLRTYIGLDFIAQVDGIKIVV